MRCVSSRDNRSNSSSWRGAPALAESSPLSICRRTGSIVSPIRRVGPWPSRFTLDHDGALSFGLRALCFVQQRGGAMLPWLAAGKPGRRPSSDDGQESADSERRRKGQRQGEDLHRAENARQRAGARQRDRGQRQQPGGGRSRERQQRGLEQRDLEDPSSIAVCADPPGENKPQDERGRQTRQAHRNIGDQPHRPASSKLWSHAAVRRRSPFPSLLWCRRRAPG